MQFDIVDLGLVDFNKAQGIQKDIFEYVKNTDSGGTLIFCQHHPVITLGRFANRKNILASKQELTERGIDVYETERGGDVTYHGPGQLLAYPVFNLSYLKKDIHFFLRFLEGIVIELLSDFGIKGIRLPGLTGVWVDKRKICSIGIAIRHWITFHGLSLNIKKEDLDNFKLLRPCGMDTEMTSLETILGRCPEINEIKQRLSYKFLGYKEE